jgi:hypothetical protein
MGCLLQTPPVESLSPATSQNGACPPAIASIPQGSKQDNRDSAVCSPNIGVALQIRVFLQQLPSFFIRLRPVLPVDAGADLALLRHLVQAPLYRDANVASGASRAVSVDQFQNGASLLAGQRKFALQTLQSFMDERHIGFEVNRSNEDLNLAAVLGILPCACLCLSMLRLRDERSRPPPQAHQAPQADPCKKKGAACSYGALTHNPNAIARLR